MIEEKQQNSRKLGHDLFDDDDDNIHRGFWPHLGDKSPPKQQQTEGKKWERIRILDHLYI